MYRGGKNQNKMFQMQSDAQFHSSSLGTTPNYILYVTSETYIVSKVRPTSLLFGLIL